MKTWEEMSEQEQLACTHYDMYKDVYGVHPRWIDYDNVTVEELKQWLADLQVALESVIEEEKRAQAAATEEFEAHVAATIANGAKDRETALRWIMDASICNGDWEFLCYEYNLPYGYFQKAA